MPDSRTPVRHSWMAPAVAFAAALTITLAATRDQPVEPARADLVVDVDDEVTEIVEDRMVTYRITVANNTHRDLHGLELAVTSSASLDVSPRRPWPIDVGAGATAVVEVNGVLHDPPQHLVEVVVTACVSGDAAPTVCRSDVDSVPAGDDGDGGWSWLMIVMLIGQLLVTLPIVVLVGAAAFRSRKR
ncbi:hypothetical protein Lesp02_22910 [Lentzea sp. NBRC 105346]|uniref:hypothetical protein n=1 Tax=Lentzea sp. NBRC 105346 TaxID=3032205 RepID=UPI0024A2CB43|nr:hypothetical protein [Lentzea sp. NBRC 105346]GLZ30101.1 hypothetical protein Lesp02_22910 [Lentzea sp. NBRC 105346]